MDFKFGSIAITSDTEYDISVSAIEEKSDYLKVKIKIDFGGKITPKPVVLDWEFPAKNIISTWTPDTWCGGIMPDWWPHKVNSRSALSMPLMSHFSTDGKNVLTISLSDVLTPVAISSGVCEETANMDCRLSLFTELVSAMSEYEVDLVLDMRDVSYMDAIKSAGNMWESLGYKSARVPDDAMRPMYSTWYSYHQNLDRDAVIEELKLAKEYGMNTVIVDDGWQTTDSGRGYAFCGDWRPERIPDMKGFVEDVHNLGMKYMMWYSVPFVGPNSKAWDRFSGKFLNIIEGTLSSCTLDPRYPDVRDYLISTYENAVKEWNMDGLKLDFIDAFALTKYSAEPNDEMDFESLEEAVCTLLKEVRERLIKINPDIMLEFRQKYVGPIMRTYGNMLRVTDCPMSFMHNRVGSLDLRLTSADSAVHSDMLMWNYEDSAESAALQIINILFSVPQISVLIEKLPDEHKKMLKFYMDFWNEHRDCLMNGKLTAKNPEANYSIVCAENDCELIAVSFSKNVIDAGKAYDRLYFINGSWEKELLVNNCGDEYSAAVTVYDCVGNAVLEEKCKITKGYNPFSVPESGMVCIRRAV